MKFIIDEEMVGNKSTFFDLILKRHVRLLKKVVEKNKKALLRYYTRVYKLP